MSQFDRRYTEYWENALEKSVDGAPIASVAVAGKIMDICGFNDGRRVLDLGCSSGRMCSVLSERFNAVYGVEMDTYAVKKAASMPYVDVRQGGGENIPYENGYFDAVFCWAVFELIDHHYGLIQMNRVLSLGGKVLLTGKNDLYHLDDVLAFKAEKNAFLKKFPGRFTRLNHLIMSLSMYGFHLDRIMAFPRRGDFGSFIFYDYSDEYVEMMDFQCYEYLISCHKVSGVCFDSLFPKLDFLFSRTSGQLARSAGFFSANQFFERVGVD